MQLNQVTKDLFSVKEFIFLPSYCMKPITINNAMMKTRRKSQAVIIFYLKINMLFVILVTFLQGNLYSQSQQRLSVNKIPKLAFIMPPKSANVLPGELNDLKSLRHSLLVAGFSVTEVNSISSGKLNGFDILVIPFASAKILINSELEIIKNVVRSGTNLIFDGNSLLTEALNIRHLKDSITVSNTRDLRYSNNKLYWTTPCTLTPIDNTKAKYTVLSIDDTTKLPISISGNYDKGKFIYFGTLFDPITDKGYTRFPFLIETLYDKFSFRPIAERQAAEMYFDAGNRSNDTLSADDLAKLWRKNKVKRIYASGWYYDTDYDYAALIKACHRNGISVLCWLETPMISLKFWENHPEWREKTVFQRDAHIDWRYLMDLADTNCRNEVFKEFKQFLLKYDWDGVDFAELYFEPSPVGPELPENFTPMNSVVRQEFMKSGGFDPVLLFDTTSTHYWKKNNADWKKFAAYRKLLLFRLKQEFLTFFTHVKQQKKDLEVMLTVLDVSITPELSDYIGEDTQNSLALFKKYDISLQVEDPSNCWGLTPQRYDKMGKLYRQYVKGRESLIFDCNVVSAHELGYGGFPSEIPTGEEIRQIAYNMDLHDVRPAFYSEDVVSDADYRNISTVLANKAHIISIDSNQWSIRAPKTITVNTGNSNSQVLVDNRPWFAGEGQKIIVPLGEHRLTFSNSVRDTNTLWIRNISGQLWNAIFTSNTVEFVYSEPIASCYVILNNKPGKVEVDGKTTNCLIYPNEDDEFVVKLPQGKHIVKITATE